jgi:hypothetical protein
VQRLARAEAARPGKHGAGRGAPAAAPPLLPPPPRFKPGAGPLHLLDNSSSLLHHAAYLARHAAAAQQRAALELSFELLVEEGANPEVMDAAAMVPIEWHIFEVRA